MTNALTLSLLTPIRLQYMTKTPLTTWVSTLIP
eukprot:CAMPEP_0182469008 /NCGR_PEP_ID=MMETSP1319-20130603/16389_1 /TAXON_ID=172717 /ORGANISM="Bolidomonas pacifica, Strain RCC208" /LENGTH=32 /DNA_ID= /DNA_START= /DNA_END= /DNA_ORIENTATION=